MTEQEMEKLIIKMQEVFPTHEDLNAFRQETRSSFETIERDLKKVIRVHNLDEEMTAVYTRLKRLEEAAGINPAAA